MVRFRAAGQILLSVIGWLQAVAAPRLRVPIRLWLAQAFLVLDMQRMMGAPASPFAVPLDAVWWMQTLHAVMQSDVGLVIQTVCPVLLAFGLLTRPAALGLLIQVATLPMPSPAAAFWGALLLWLLVAGPGPLSLDHLLGRGALLSPLPGAAAAARAMAWLRRGVPAVTVALRLWVATAILAPHLIMQPGMMLPPGPAMIASLPLAWAVAAALLLLAGLGTRWVALGLLLLVPFGQLAGTADVRLPWALLLLIVMVEGSGPLGIDRWLAARLRRIVAAPDPAGLPHVVVVGGGFGGVAAVQGLHHTACRITLIDQRNHHLFQPLLYQVATASLSPADIATPIRTILRSQPNVRVLLGEVTGVDAETRSVMLDRGSIPFDHLVIATGAQHSYFGRDDWAPVAPGLKTIEDSTAIRRRLLVAFEEAEAAEPGPGRDAWLTFVIVGGGPTGVEMAGAIAELARHGLSQEFRRIDPAGARVILVQSGPRLLPAFPEALSRDALHTLQALGVEVLLDSRVEDVTDAGATVSQHVIAARTVLWAAGVMASPAARWLGITPDRAGRVTVGPHLEVAGWDRVYAIGDTAASDGWSGQSVPGLAPAAKQGGAYVARVIRADLAGRPAPAPFRYRHFGSLATIGRKSAVADFGWIRVRGALAWWLWGAAHIAFLAGGRNRATVLVQWVWAYLTWRGGTRLITNRT